MEESLPKTKLAEQSAINKPSKAKILAKIWFKATGLALGLALLLLIITMAGAALWANVQFNQFLRAAQVSRSEFIQTAKTGWQQPVQQIDNHVNILVLGVDSLANRGQANPLTDTIMLVSLDLNSGKINTLPIPRDLWSEEYQTKINALLYYGEKYSAEHPEQFPQEVIGNLTGVPIHYTVVLSLNNLQELIDLLGGVEVEVKQSFTDTEFPRTDVDVTQEIDPTKLYETVTFTQGKEMMSGERALKYIRSRHSADSEGTDLSRGQRQQLVIQAIFQRLSSIKQLASNPELSGRLYRYYLDSFSRYLPITDLIALAKQLVPVREQLVFQSHSLSITDPKIKTVGVLTNPPLEEYQNQWVYVIVDPAAFQQEAKTALTLDQAVTN